MQQRRKAKADPTKAFFVRMLTRDISLDDCILDLIDNSVDGAWKTSGSNPSELVEDDALDGFRIEIETSGETFRITDNCGGITLDDAVDYAFTFGRDDPNDGAIRDDEANPNDEASRDGGAYSVGVYGIGMKRAVFKMGDTITIDSTYEDADGTVDSFRVPIKVSDWLKVKLGPWDFEIEPSEPANESGVTIEVADLFPGTKSRLADPTYERRLRRILARDYMVPLMRGLKMSVNGTEISGWKPSLNLSEDFIPLRNAYDDGNVRVEIIAGMAAQPPDDSSPDEENSEDPSGWYVLCNGRVVLASDTTETTGWGIDKTPKWHRQYSGFVGLILFSSNEPVLLPMTTTKRSVDVSSEIYRRALPKMAEPTKAWTSYTNARKQNVSVAKPLEGKVAATSVVAVTHNKVMGLPSLGRHKRVQLANVAYSVDVDRMRQLASAFGDITISYKEVGMRSFEFSFESLVSEDS